MDTDHVDHLAFHINTLVLAEPLLESMGQAARAINLYGNSDTTDFMSFNKDRSIFSLDDKFLKSGDQFLYLGSNSSSPGKDINIRLRKAWTVMKGYQPYGNLFSLIK